MRGLSENLLLIIRKSGTSNGNAKVVLLNLYYRPLVARPHTATKWLCMALPPSCLLFCYCITWDVLYMESIFRSFKALTRTSNVTFIFQTLGRCTRRVTQNHNSDSRCDLATHSRSQRSGFMMVPIMRLEATYIALMLCFIIKC